MTSVRFLAVAGNIGAGKSSLTALLARRFGASPAYEPAAENPFLADFYADMPRWGFHSQVFFLAHRIRQHQALAAAPGLVVQDRSLYEDAEIFARHLHVAGHLAEREWATYRELYGAVCDSLPPPDGVVYLAASLPTLKERIARRGREYEKALPEAYLARLNTLYEEWARTFTRAPVLRIETDGLDFVGRPEDAERVFTAVATRWPSLA